MKDDDIIIKSKQQYNYITNIKSTCICKCIYIHYSRVCYSTVVNISITDTYCIARKFNIQTSCLYKWIFPLYNKTFLCSLPFTHGTEQEIGTCILHYVGNSIAHYRCLNLKYLQHSFVDHTSKPCASYS